ncbi:hypothetical protein E3P99_02170 [Wallemia hederae]|uniref:Thioredoxin-like fold domain-containing protein n=1 Tax=Wallemia hederae TaxID=1540922 RepID=A0A4V4LTW5_9BASI|nr:hypothetical protein E3P99_02170 [Wallemia hederae]
MFVHHVIYTSLSIWSLASIACAGIVEDVVTSITGVNMTQRIEEQNQLSEHAMLITDERWKDLIEGGSDRDLWLVLITSGKQDDFDKLLKESFNELAEELCGEEGKQDENVHLGRADYSQIKELSTRWLLFQVPVYVIAEAKGRVLRFVSPYTLTPSSTNLRKLLEGQYRQVEPWHGRLSYDGEYATYMDMYTRISLYLHTKLDLVPGLVWYIGIASLSSSLLKWMHKDDKKRMAQRGRVGRVGSRADGKDLKPGAEGVSTRTRSKTRAE